MTNHNKTKAKIEENLYQILELEDIHIHLKHH